MLLSILWSFACRCRKRWGRAHLVSSFEIFKDGELADSKPSPDCHRSTAIASNRTAPVWQKLARIEGLRDHPDLAVPLAHDTSPMHAISDQTEIQEDVERYRAVQVINAHTSPFELDDDDSSSVQCIDEFFEEVWIVNDSGKYFIRALLDPGAQLNIVSSEKIERIGCAMTQYKGPPLQGFGQADLIILGQVTLHFQFESYQPAKTWTMDFLVWKAAHFDLLLGAPFLDRARLLQEREY